MKIKRKIIRIDEERCNGCGLCVPSCAEGAIEVVNGKAKLRAEKFCDGLGACLGECPNDALIIVEREAEDFDEEAVEEFLHEQKAFEEMTRELPLAGGCPSAKIQTFQPTAKRRPVTGPDEAGEGSALSQWPVQISLVPPNAPFLRDADLLVVSDCVPVAYPFLHRDFLPGKIVLLGCPKFDDTKAYVEKFTSLFKMNSIRSLTILDMEVPCCSAMSMIIRKAAAEAGATMPIERVTVSTRGEILKRDKIAA